LISLHHFHQFNFLEVTKVKLQIQPREEPLMYRSLAHTLRRSMHEDGFWRGLVQPGLAATVLRAFTYTGFRIGLYPAVKNAFDSSSSTSPSLGTKILAGATTGAISASVFCPVDVVRIRMQAQAGTLGPDGVTLVSGLHAGRRREYSSTLDAFRKILKHEGLGGGWQGAGPTVARAAGLSGSQLASYDSLKWGLKQGGWLSEGVPLHLTCSLTSGLIAQAVIQPMDTVRSVVMTAPRLRKPQGTAAAATANTAAASTALTTFSASTGWAAVAQGLSPKKGGGIHLVGAARFLYRGFGAACFRQGPIMLIQMPLVEQLRLLLGLGCF
jgi:hypothetical protein